MIELHSREETEKHGSYITALWDTFIVEEGMPKFIHHVLGQGYCLHAPQPKRESATDG